MSSKYLPELDIAKVIGLYLMILGHRDLLDADCTQWIYSYHMPLFFVLSGITFHHKPFKENIDKVFRSLIVPFLIMSCIWCLYYLACYIHGELPLKDIIPYIAGSFISPGKNFLSLHPLCVYLWFLIALAAIKMIASMFKSKMMMLGVSLMSLIVAVVLSQYGVVLPFALDSAMLAFLFFTIGYFLSHFIQKNYSTRLIITALVLSSAVVTLISAKNGVVDINYNLYGSNVFMFLIAGFAGSMMILAFSKLIYSKLQIELGGGRGKNTFTWVFIDRWFFGNVDSCI